MHFSIPCLYLALKKSEMNKLDRSFFCRDVLKVAPELLGKYIVIAKNGNISYSMITEVEAYKGEKDRACHAYKGRTDRTEIMYHEGGHLYVYLIYGIHWMLNVVTGNKEEPQAVLIRGVEGYNGPGRVSGKLGIDRSFYGEDLILSDRIWIEEKEKREVNYKRGPRIGIEYAGEYWKNVPWRYYIHLI